MPQDPSEHLFDATGKTVSEKSLREVVSLKMRRKSSHEILSKL